MQHDVSRRALLRYRNTGIAFAALCAALSALSIIGLLLRPEALERAWWHHLAFYGLAITMFCMSIGTAVSVYHVILMTRDLWRRDYFFSWA